MQRSLRLNLIILFMAGLLFWSALASMLPTLPLYVQDLGGSSLQVGWVMGSFAVGLLVARPWLGSLSDLRSRKLVLLIGMATVMLAPIGYWLTGSVPVLMGLRAFHGISIAAFATGYVTLVVDLAPEERRGEMIGLMSLVNPIGAGAGLTLGGLLQDWFGYTVLFLTAASVGACGLVLTTFLQEPARHPHPEGSAAQNTPYWAQLSNPRIRALAVVLLLVGLAFGTRSTFASLLIQASQADLNVGIFFGTSTLSGFFVRLVTGRASDRWGRGVFITTSLSCYTLAMILVALADHTQAFLLAALIEGTGFGILIPMISALVADRVQPHQRGLFFSLAMAGFDLGIGVAGPLFGSLALLGGYRVVFLAAALLSALSLAAFLGFSNGDRQQSLRFALGLSHDTYALKDLRQNAST